MSIRRTPPSFRRSLLISVLILVAAQLFLIVDRAHAEYGSGTLMNYKTTTASVAGTPLATSDGVMLGDSITARCWPALDTWLKANAGPHLTYRYHSGAPMVDGIDWLEANAPDEPLTVVAMGTNDLFNPPAVTPQLQRLIAGTTEPESLVLVDTYAARTKLPAATQVADATNSGWVNAQLHAALPPAQIVNYAAAVASLRKTGRPGTAYYLEDGVHPKVGVGCNWWAVVLGPTIKARWLMVTGGPK
jgi:hypothetical protein